MSSASSATVLRARVPRALAPCRLLLCHADLVSLGQVLELPRVDVNLVGLVAIGVLWRLGKDLLRGRRVLLPQEVEDAPQPWPTR